jgi:phosphoribosylformylglycinamidine cyclo-ligase
MVAVVAPHRVEEVKAALEAAGETVHLIGRIEDGARGCTVVGSADAWSAREAWEAVHLV